MLDRATDPLLRRELLRVADENHPRHLAEAIREIEAALPPRLRREEPSDEENVKLVSGFSTNETARPRVELFLRYASRFPAWQRYEAFPMNDAQCSCGAVALSLQGPSRLVVACHCLDCQRRTGAPFGVGAFYPAEVITVSGTPREFSRNAASGEKVRNYFCPNCGSTVFWKADNLPALIGVAVGTMADPKHPAPVRSVFERSKHAWVEIDGAAVEHFPESSAPKNRN